MCRSKDQGGRRCTGRHSEPVTDANTPDHDTYPPITSREPLTAPPHDVYPGDPTGQVVTVNWATGNDRVAVQVGSVNRIPTREDTDRMAENYRGVKDWSDTPLDDAGRRLYALRESGWTGPVDQDGYATVTGEAAAILHRMATDRGETPDWTPEYDGPDPVTARTVNVVADSATVGLRADVVTGPVVINMGDDR